MRKVGALGAIVFLCLCHHVCADDTVAEPSATVETAAATTRERGQWLAGDVYPARVQDALKKLYEALKSFWLTLAFGDLEKVADYVLGKIWWYLFGIRPTQEESWLKFRTVFLNYLREWWLATPLVPVETLKTGVWHALQRIAGSEGQAVLGNFPEYQKLKKLVLEGKNEVVGRWVEDVRRRMTQGVLEGDEVRTQHWKGRWGKSWGSGWGPHWNPQWGGWGKWHPRWGWHGGAREGGDGGEGNQNGDRNEERTQEAAEHWDRPQDNN